MGKIRKKKRLTQEQVRQIQKELPVQHIDADLSPKPLVDAVRKSLRRLVFDILSARQRKEISDDVKNMRPTYKGERKNHDGFFGFLLKVVELLWTGVDYDLVMSYCPQSCPWIKPDARSGGIKVEWHTLLSEKTDGGTFWYGKDVKPIQINGGKYIPAFSRHAIERMRDRVGGGEVPFYDVVTDLQCRLAEGLLGTSGRIEPWIKNGDLHGFQSWESVNGGCGECKLNLRFAEMLGFTPSKKLYILAAYHPCEFRKRFAFALTSLRPGMRGTPQYNRDIVVPESAAELAKMRSCKHILELQHAKSPIMKMVT